MTIVTDFGKSSVYSRRRSSSQTITMSRTMSGSGLWLRLIGLITLITAITLITLITFMIMMVLLVVVIVLVGRVRKSSNGGRYRTT